MSTRKPKIGKKGSYGLRLFDVRKRRTVRKHPQIFETEISAQICLGRRKTGWERLCGSLCELGGEPEDKPWLQAQIYRNEPGKKALVLHRFVYLERRTFHSLVLGGVHAVEGTWQICKREMIWVPVSNEESGELLVELHERLSGDLHPGDGLMGDEEFLTLLREGRLIPGGIGGEA